MIIIAEAVVQNDTAGDYDIAGGTLKHSLPGLLVG